MVIEEKESVYELSSAMKMAREFLQKIIKSGNKNVKKLP